MIKPQSQPYTPFNDLISAIDAAIFLAETTGISHRIESTKGYLWVIPDNDKPIGKLIERVEAPQALTRTKTLMAKPSDKKRLCHKPSNRFSNVGEDDMVLVKKIVQALARQQAKQDHELMKKNETRSHIR